MVPHEDILYLFRETHEDKDCILAQDKKFLESPVFLINAPLHFFCQLKIPQIQFLLQFFGWLYILVLKAVLLMVDNLILVFIAFHAKNIKHPSRLLSFQLAEILRKERVFLI